jgi:hypothetical protein
VLVQAPLPGFCTQIADWSDRLTGCGGAAKLRASPPA